MRKVLFLILLFMLLTPFAFADREVETVTGYNSSTLVKRGDWKIYRIDFVATANGGSFTVYDSLTAAEGANSNVKTEQSEATALNGKPLDFTNKPIEGSTGLYLVVNNANVVLHYK